MIRSVAGSFVARIIVMLLTLSVVVMVTRTLGDEGQGTAALIQLGVLLIVSITNFIAGGAVVFLAPRFAPRDLLVPAYVWSLSVAALFYGLFSLVEIVPEGYVMHVAALGAIQALFTFHLQVLMGFEQIRAFNVAVSIQAFVLALSVALGFYVLSEPSIDGYVNALFASFTITYILTAAFSIRRFRGAKQMSMREAFNELWRYGKFAQSGNILQLLNYRSNLYLLERLLQNGRGAVGLFSIGLYAGEAIWNVGKSLSLVQHARISNSEDPDYNRKLTLSFLFLSAASSVVLIAIMLLIPEAFYLWIFGQEMAGMHSVLEWIAPGIFANACSMIFAHHFSGSGKHDRNTIGSAVGLASLLIAAFPLIPRFGVEGAAMSASIGYIAQFIAMWAMFTKGENLKWYAIVPPKEWVNAALNDILRRSK